MMSNRSFAVLMAIVAILAAALFTLDPNNRAQDTVEIEPVVSTTSSTTTSTTTTIAPAPVTTTTQPAPKVVEASTENVDTFFECIRWRESRGDYTAVNPTGTFMGAYQFYQEGWDTFAARIDRHDLVGVPPHTAVPADQDAVALAAYNELGAKPWGGACQ